MPEKRFDRLIDLFGLAVGPWMPGSRRSRADPKQTLNFCPKPGDKKGAAVGDYLVWEAVQTDEPVYRVEPTVRGVRRVIGPGERHKTVGMST